MANKQKSNGFLIYFYMKTKVPGIDFRLENLWKVHIKDKLQEVMYQLYESEYE